MILWDYLKKLKIYDFNIVKSRDIMCDFCLDGLNNILSKINMHKNKFLRIYSIIPERCCYYDKNEKNHTKFMEIFL
jgi:hypothetical protein